jgi:hypothetical protein
VCSGFRYRELIRSSRKENNQISTAKTPDELKVSSGVLSL